MSVLFLVGGAATSTALGIASTKTSSTKVLGAFAGLSAKVEHFVTIPGALGTIIFGTWLVRDGNWAIKGWLIAAYVLFVVALGIGGGVLGRHSQQVARKAGELIGQGVTESEELQREAAAPRIQVLGMIEIVIIISFIYLMIGKPARNHPHVTFPNTGAGQGIEISSRRPVQVGDDVRVVYSCAAGRSPARIPSDRSTPSR